MGDLLHFSKPVAIIILPKWPTFFCNFLKGSRYFIFLVKSFLGNFYKQLAFFYWSRWWQKDERDREKGCERMMETEREVERDREKG